jgi:cytosine deaminase
MAWKAFNAMKEKWKGKVVLEGVVFVLPSSEFEASGKASTIVDIAMKYGGRVLGTSFSSPSTIDISEHNITLPNTLSYQGPKRSENFLLQLNNFFQMAQQYGLHIDVHIDEHSDGQSDSLLQLARSTILFNYQHKVVASHCCSLSLACSELFHETITTLKKAQIIVVFLPTCNVFMQDHVPGATPRWRGIPPIWEMKAVGIPIVFASDNVRDAFYPFGDMDMMDIFTQSCRIAQIGPDSALEWLDSVTSIPRFFNHLQNFHF